MESGKRIEVVREKIVAVVAAVVVIAVKIAAHKTFLIPERWFLGTLPPVALMAFWADCFAVEAASSVKGDPHNLETNSPNLVTGS